ncbi:hypothetical protein B0H17DRAFT_1328657 [Mycena rosella]|uniref:DUF7025 domain-containing protein n=1 Tax=Mycena rosella TaxID=1033263 RepID=A0AAD7DU72_MYCRO|nr:hypothetical protein B0H17DRAFT_1328657 [Mycena rosella]
MLGELAFLWTLFRPGTIIHSKIRGYDRAFKLASYNTIACGENAGFYLMGSSMDCDGKNFGLRAERLKIPPFGGSTDIGTLSTAPLDMRVRKAEIRAALMERGRRFQTMQGQRHGEYSGVVIEQSRDHDKKFNVRGLLALLFRVHWKLTTPRRFSKSRVMVDGISYNRIRADFAWEAAKEEAAT